MLLRSRKKGDEDDDELPPVDRIVLYIDDLDRCPENRVVEVLQAVHLLLAFPLFVVVVGVDSRWLLHSLRQQSKAFRQQGNESLDAAKWQTTPLNYLEKIFQIPFALRPMGKPGYASLIEYLTKAATNQSNDFVRARKAQNLNGTENVAQKEPSQSISPLDPSPGQGTPGGDARSKRVAVAPEHMAISEEEQSFMQGLAQFIPTPRAAKRFVNIYRLLRASADDAERAVLLEQEPSESRLYRAVLLMLSLQIGYPDQSAELLAEIVEAPETATISSLIANRHADEEAPTPANGRVSHGEVLERPRDERDKWSEVAEKIQRLEGIDLNRIHCGGDLKKWARRVARYSFQSSQTVAQGGDFDT
jgi:hypothetical protein